MEKINRLNKVLFAACLLLCNLFLLLEPLSAQSDIEGKLSIDKIDIKDGFIEMKIIACDSYGQALFPGTTKEGIKVSMSVENRAYDSLEVHQVLPISSNDSSTTIEQAMKIHFLLDISGSMKGNKLENAKKVIREMLYSPALKNAKKEFSWFHDDIGMTQQLRPDNINQIVERIKVQKDTDLHGAISQKIEELKSFSGTKVIILLTDGINDIKNNPAYVNGAKTPISEAQVLQQIGNLDSSFQVYPIGIGNNASESFLQAIASRTKSDKDRYSFGLAPGDLVAEFRKIVNCLQPNYILKCFPPEEDKSFGVELRRFSVNYTSATNNVYVANKEAVLGSPARNQDVSNEKADFGSVFFTGLILIGLLLGVFSLIVPVYNNYYFKQKYVKRYGAVKTPNVRGFDPMSNEAYSDEDEVVVKGDKLMLYNTWKYCAENPEAGADHSDFSDLFLFANSGTFFSQKGPYLILNWFWYGALGGLLGWSINLLVEGLEIPKLTNLFSLLDNGNSQISSAVYAETLVGFSLGLCMVVALATVEELGQSRQFNLGRVLGRGLLGLVLGTLVFFLEGMLITTFIPDRFFGGLLGWGIFGVLMGYILSLFSSIEWSNGLKGGLVAGFAGFLIYYTLSLPFFAGNNPEMIRMLSYMLYGAVLGSILKTVVSRLEDFELLILSPKSFSGRISPISKWLKSSSIDYIEIGKDPACHLYVKWEDPMARRRHARLSYDGKAVSIAPEEGTVWINDRLISGVRRLKDQDKIMLGEGSATLFQFKSRNPDEKGQSSNYIQGSNGHGNGKFIKKRTAKEINAVRQQIVIKRRN